MEKSEGLYLIRDVDWKGERDECEALGKGDLLQTGTQFVGSVGKGVSRKATGTSNCVTREGRAKQGSLDLLCLKEGHEGLGGSRATLVSFREWGGGSRWWRHNLFE